MTPMPDAADNLRIPDICPEHANIATEIALIKHELKTNTEISKEILHTLKGNGQEGLTTRAALNKAAISRAWWWLGALSAALLGIVGYVLRSKF